MLHAIDVGRGPAVVLLHAFPMDSALWAAQRRSLAEAGYRVVTPDLPGFGGSAPMDGEPSLEAAADEVAGLLDHLGIEHAVVGGLSMGGYVAMALLRRHPERLTGLVLADTKGTADTAEAAAGRLAMAEAVEASGRTAGLAEEMIGNLLGETTRRSRPEVTATVQRWIAAQPPAGVVWAQRAMAARPDSLGDLARFARPVLVLYGEQDTISGPAIAEQMADATRAGGAPTTVVEIPAAGHLTAVESPEAVTRALLGWLRANVTA